MVCEVDALGHANLLSFPTKMYRAKKALADVIKAYGLKARQLVRANATRWSSFFKSLTSILDLKKAIVHVITSDKLSDKKNRMFSNDQLKKVRM